jgi:hypothetical protein
MNDEEDQKSDADRLGKMKAELSRHFGKFTRWRALCLERNVTSVVDQIRLAEEVLSAPSTGTVAEWLTHNLRLQGSKSFDVDEMLTGGAVLGKDGA